MPLYVDKIFEQVNAACDGLIRLKTRKPRKAHETRTVFNPLIGHIETSHIETSQLICIANQFADFYMIGDSVR